MLQLGIPNMPTKKDPVTPDTIWLCKGCDTEKNISQFRKNRAAPGGYTAKCIECTKKYVNAYQNSEKGRTILRQSGLKYKYGIDLKGYNKLFMSQGGVCAICGELPVIRHKKNGTVRFLDVDHNHHTGEVRGLLCLHCNHGVGYLRTPDVLRKAADYIDQKGSYIKPPKEYATISLGR